MTLFWTGYNGFTGWCSFGNISLETVIAINANSNEDDKRLAVLGATEGKLNNWNGYDWCLVSAMLVGACERYNFMTDFLLGAPVCEGANAFHATVAKLNEAFLNTQTGRWEQYLNGQWVEVKNVQQQAWFWHRLPMWERRDTLKQADEYWERHPGAKEHSKAMAQAWIDMFVDPVMRKAQVDYCRSFIKKYATAYPNYVNTPKAQAAYSSFFLNNQTKTKQLFREVYESGFREDGVYFEAIRRVKQGFGLDVWLQRALAIDAKIGELYI